MDSSSVATGPFAPNNLPDVAEEEDDVPPIDLTNTPDQHLYPVEEEDEEEVNSSNAFGTSFDPAPALAPLTTTRTTPLSSSSTPVIENNEDNDVTGNAIASPPNAVAPAASFSPPAYREGTS